MEKRAFQGKSQHTVSVDMSHITQPWKDYLIMECFVLERTLNII